MNNEISRQRILISNLHASNCSKDKEIKEKSDCVASMKKENKLLKKKNNEYGILISNLKTINHCKDKEIKEKDEEIQNCYKIISFKGFI